MGYGMDKGIGMSLGLGKGSVKDIRKSKMNELQYMMIIYFHAFQWSFCDYVGCGFHVEMNVTGGVVPGCGSVWKC